MAEPDQQSGISILLFSSKVDVKPYKVLLFRRSESARAYQNKLGPIISTIEQRDKGLKNAAWRVLKAETGLDQKYVELWRRGSKFEFTEDSTGSGQQVKAWKIWPFAFQFKKDPVNGNNEVDTSVLAFKGEHTSCEWVGVDDLLGGGQFLEKCIPKSDIALRRIWAHPDGELYQGLESLRHDTASEPRDLATNAVRTLVKIVESQERDQSQMGSFNVIDWWRSFKLQAFQLALNGRPNTGDVTSSAVVLALKDARNKVDAQSGNVLENVKQSLQQSVQKREKIPPQMDEHLSNLLQEQLRAWSQEQRVGDRPLTILTLNEAPAIQAAILRVLHNDEKCRIELHMPESHKLFEGTSLAQTLTDEAQDLKEKQKREGSSGAFERLSIVVSSNASTSILNPGVDIVIVDADRISEAGDLGTWSAALATILATKKVTKDSAKVICLGETEKIAPFGSTDEHIQAQNDDDNQLKRISSAQSVMSIRRVETEWIPARYIDFYVCEEGIWSKDDIMAKSKQIAEVAADVFDGLQDS